MGKTYRKYSGTAHRKPKGRKQALIAGVRKGAIPPDAWDDIGHNGEVWMPWKVALKLWKLNKSQKQITKTLRQKFNLQPHEINKILEALKRREINLSRNMK